MLSKHVNIIIPIPSLAEIPSIIWLLAIEVGYFAIFYLLRRNIPFMLDVTTKSLFQTADLSLIKYQIFVTSLAESRFIRRVYLFLFLLIIEILSSPVFVSSFCLDLSYNSRSETIDIPSRAHSQHVGTTSLLRLIPGALMHTLLHDLNLRKCTIRAIGLPRDLSLFS